MDKSLPCVSQCVCQPYVRSFGFTHDNSCNTLQDLEIEGYDVFDRLRNYVDQPTSPQVPLHIS